MKTRNLSDWIVALCVIASSAVLFTALAFALSGKAFQREGRHVKVYFQDTTGILPNAQVRYGGAIAGRVSAIRMLTPEERMASDEPMNTVQVTLALSPETPSLPRDVRVNIQSDTILSDKFVEISGGNPMAPALREIDILQGIPPATFDELSRTLEDTLNSVRSIVSGGAGAAGTGALMKRLNTILDDAQTTMTQAKSLVQEGRTLVQSGNTLLASNQANITETITRLNNASAKIESLASRGDDILKKNESNINTGAADLRVILQNLKITTTYSKYFLNDLYQRPQRLLWGGVPKDTLPTERAIIQSMKVAPR